MQKHKIIIIYLGVLLPHSILFGLWVLIQLDWLIETKSEKQAMHEELLTLMYNSRGRQINEIDFAGCLLQD